MRFGQDYNQDCGLQTLMDVKGLSAYRILAPKGFRVLKLLCDGIRDCAAHVAQKYSLPRNPTRDQDSIGFKRN